MKPRRSVMDDPDLRLVGRALRRAAAKALALARNTRTPFYVYEHGRIVNILNRRRKKPSRRI